MATKKKPVQGKLVGRDAPPGSRKPNNLTKKSKADEPSALWKFAKSITQPRPGELEERKRKLQENQRRDGNKGRK